MLVDDIDERIIRPKDLKAIDGLSEGVRRQMQRRGEYPRYRQTSPHTVGVLWSELREWLKSRPLAQANKAGPGRGKKSKLLNASPN
jgi:predicted DNA-binding transcriptional regulator AlpA